MERHANMELTTVNRLCHSLPMTTDTQYPNLSQAAIRSIPEAAAYVVTTQGRQGEPTATVTPAIAFDRDQALTTADFFVERGFYRVEINGVWLRPDQVTVVVPVKVHVDTQVWQDTYGMDTADVMPDIQAHVARTVLYHANQGLKAIAAGAVIDQEQLDANQ